MKKLLLTLAFVVFGFLFASAQNDTVCAGATGVSYWVNGMAGSTYSWTINGGTQASGSNTDSITIDFSSTTGIDTIYVLETDSNGCPGTPVALAIVRMPNPTATIAGTTALCYDSASTMTVTLTGTSPWSLTYNIGATPTTVNNITTSPYTFNTSGLTSSTTYTLVSVTDRLSCLTSLSGGSATATVTVYPLVVTPPIQHN